MRDRNPKDRHKDEQWWTTVFFDHYCLYSFSIYVNLQYYNQQMSQNVSYEQGRIQDFKLGGGALKKIAPSGGRRENFWGISCEKSRFYAKKSYFSNFRGGARNFWGISCEKSRFYAKKKSYFFQF